MSDDPYLTREAEKYSDPIPSREFILAYLAKQGTPANRESLCQALKLTTETQQEALRRRLRAMERDGQLVFTRRQCYALPALLDLVRGTVIGHRDGYGFLRVAGQKEDLFLSAGQMRFALHGDVVLAQPLRPDRRGRCEARIVRVLEPRPSQIVGRYFTEAGLSFVVPDDTRLGFDIAIPADQQLGARQGQVVVVLLTQRPIQRMQAIGAIVEVLGERLAPGIEIEIAIRNHNIPHQWPEEVTAQIADLAEQVPAEAMLGRVDLRHLPLVTIDGEDARDFDDAVYCEANVNQPGGWRLWVAIADVSHYVPVGTALDQEACHRGNSVYFPSQVIPMLPEQLSNGLCSLNPQVDRLCMVCEMMVSSKGRLVESKFYPAIMNSKARLTYTKVARILAGDEALRERYAALLPHLASLHQLFLILKKIREQRGGIEFETQETQFIFNEQRRIEQIVPLVRNDAHKLIEECMLLANTAAAQFVQKHHTAILYRVHDAPHEERLNAFNTFLQELGLSLSKKFKPGPKRYADLMYRVRQRPDRELIQAMLLRAMQPAIYSPDNRGHFGLALEGYAHFTSPIRRYPDLTLHRMIKSLLAQQSIAVNHQAAKVTVALDEGSTEALVQLGEHCSMTERRADEATREVADWLKCEFMQDHVGELFQGVVSGVTGFGLFVRLAELCIDGLVHVTTLNNDYYRFDAVGQRLIGETFGLVYRLGDVVQVKVVAVHLDERKIELTLVASECRLKRSGGVAQRINKTNPEKKLLKPTQGKVAQSKKSAVVTTQSLKEGLPASKKKSRNNHSKSIKKRNKAEAGVLKKKIAVDE